MRSIENIVKKVYGEMTFYFDVSYQDIPYDYYASALKVAAFNDFLSSGANIHIHQSSLLLVLFPASLMNHIFAPINNQHSLFVYKAIFISRSHSITGICFHYFIGRVIIYRIRRSSSFIPLI